MMFFGVLKRIVWPSPVEVSKNLLVQTQHEEWSFSQERVFMEELVYKRLTLFLSISAALIAGAINLRSTPWIDLSLPIGGSALCWVLQQTVHRAQLKLDIILQILFADDSHPTGRVDHIIKDNNRVRLVGVVVPSAICILLTALTVVEAPVAAGWIVLPSVCNH